MAVLRIPAGFDSGRSCIIRSQQSHQYSVQSNADSLRRDDFVFIFAFLKFVFLSAEQISWQRAASSKIDSEESRILTDGNDEADKQEPGPLKAGLERECLPLPGPENYQRPQEHGPDKLNHGRTTIPKEGRDL